MGAGYEATVDWILSFVNWEALRDRSRRPPGRRDLDRFKRALGRLGHPQRSAPAIHIGGTNGKGSTAAMVESLLRASGLKTGLYTSPHLVEMRERIRIDGRPIARGAFVRAAREAATVLGTTPGSGFRTTFEILTAMAFLAFRDAKADVAVIEVGLGGRLDSTNVLDPRVIALTPISLDHMEVLGETVAAIARDKSGIFRRRTPVVSGAQLLAASRVVESAARRLNAPLEFVGRDIEVEGVEAVRAGERLTVVTRQGRYERVVVPLRGAHQGGNAAVAIRSVELFLAAGRPIPPEVVAAGFRRLRWPGRFQLLAQRPLLVADGAHNPDGATRLRETLDRHAAGRPVVFVLGASEGKDLAGIVAPLRPLARGFITVGARHPRVLPARDLARLVEREVSRNGGGGTPKVEAASDLTAALALARRRAGADGVIVVAGSLYLIGDLLTEWPRHKKTW